MEHERRKCDRRFSVTGENSAKNTPDRVFFARLLVPQASPIDMI